VGNRAADPLGPRIQHIVYSDVYRAALEREGGHAALLLLPFAHHRCRVAKMALSLRPMNEEEFVRWLPSTRDWYAEDIVRSGIDEDTARRKAIEDTEDLFPEEKPSPDQFVFVVEADGDAVGDLWFAERELGLGRCLWIYDIRIDESQRGRGYGKAAMLLAEDEARQRGYNRIALNVFGGNDVARSLYLSLGYEENAIVMSKAV
jgi:GNAT superfamily N-acetyltransferase